MNGALDVVTLVTAIASALAAGSMFPFSSFVMSGLRDLPPRAGIAAMQSINIRAITPVFMMLLFGTGLAGIVVSVWSLVVDARAVGWIAGGAVVYLLGLPGITMAFNVPLNDRLARLEPEDASAPEFWDYYVTRWTAFNHVRVVAGMVAATLFTISLTL